MRAGILPHATRDAGSAAADRDALSPADGAAPRAGVASPARAADSLRVVIVDDDANFRHLLRFALRRNPRFSVVGEGGTGKDAVRLAREHRPDLMLLDITMPVMGGTEALPLVLRESPETRVVVVSGLDATVMRGEMAAMGAAAYVEKEGNLLDIGQDLLALADGA